MSSETASVRPKKKTLSREVSSPKTDRRFITGVVFIFWLITLIVGSYRILSTLDSTATTATTWKTLVYVKMGAAILFMTDLLILKIVFDRLSPRERVSLSQRMHVLFTFPKSPVAGLADESCRLVVRQNRWIAGGATLGLVIGAATWILVKRYQAIVSAEERSMTDAFYHLQFGTPAPTESPTKDPP